MSLQFESIRIPLGRGLDTKSDPRVVAPGKLTVLENAEFEQVGGLQKRNGITALGSVKINGAGSISRQRALGVRGDELLLYAEGHIWSRCHKESDWIDRGRFESCLVEQAQVAHDRSDQVRGDRAENGSVIVYAWYDVDDDKVRWQVIDKATGAIHESATETSVGGTFGSAANWPRCRAIGTMLHVYYYWTNPVGEPTPPQAIYCVVIDPTNVYGTIDSTAINLTPSNDATTSYDVTGDGTTAGYLMYRNTAGTNTYYKFDEDAASVVAHVTPARTSEGPVGVSYNANTGTLACVYVEQTATDDIKLDYLLAANLTDRAGVGIAVKSETLNKVINVTVASMLGHSSYVIWDVRSATNSPRDDLVKRATADTNSITSTKVLCRHCQLGSRARVWLDSSTERVLVHVLRDSPQQPTYVLLDAAYAVGNDDSQGSGTRDAGDEVGLVARVLYQGAQPGSNPGYVNGHTPQIQDIGSNQFTALLGNRRRLSAADKTVYAERGLVDVTYTFADARAYRGVESGETLYIPGGFLAQYDGRRAYESGFLTYPEEAVATPAGTGGSMENSSTYGYRIYWERINRRGERQISSYAGDVTVTTSAGGPGAASVAFVIPTLSFTNDDNVVLAVYRTEADPGDGAPYYRVTSLDPSVTSFIKNDPNADTISFTDGMSDATLITKETDYQNPNEDGLTVLDHIAPPAPSVVATGQARVFSTDPEDKHLVWHSKQRDGKDGVEHNDVLSARIPQAGGQVTAIDVIEGGVLVFKERAIYLIAGEGSDAFGRYPYRSPQQINLGVGCADARTLVRTNAGVFFKSERGFYLLDPAFQLHFVGAGVEDYNTLTVTAGIDVPSRHQVRYLCSATGMLVYDYLVGEWAIWPNIIGPSMVWWRDAMVTLDNSGPYQQVAGSYQNGSTGYSLVVQTGWIPIGEMFNLEKIRRIAVLGETVGTHDVRCRVAYNYVDTWIDDETITPSPGSGGDPELWRMRLSNMKPRAIKIRLEDVQQGATTWAGGVNLTAIALDVGRTPGLFHLPSGQSFGA